MFEGYTYDYLMETTLANAPIGIDTRQGSIFYDAISGITAQIARLYTDLDIVLKLIFIDTATGEYLDLRASEYGLERLPATNCRYHFDYEGTTPAVGERFFTNGLYFTLCENDGVLNLKCETPGIVGNDISAGTEATPVNTINGLKKSCFGEIYEVGTDTESDDSLRNRIREKIAGPAENGNKQHYKTWAESVDGVGKARIFPLWNGPNTVKAVLISALGTPVSDRVVKAVQEYVDPATRGYKAIVGEIEYVVGDGLGEGVANLGSHFTAASANSVTVNVALKVQIRTGHTIDSVKGDISEAINNYFQSLVMSTGEAADVVVRLSTIGAVISAVESVIDYNELMLNGDTANIFPGDDGVPVLGRVDIDVL